MTRPIPRRKFMKKAIGAAAAGVLSPGGYPRGRLRAHESLAKRPHQPGFCGRGRHGTQHLRVLLRNPDVHVRAVCDVYEPHRKQAKARVDDRYENEDCIAYNDFRALLDRDDIDAIVIGSPDTGTSPSASRPSRRARMFTARNRSHTPSTKAKPSYRRSSATEESSRPARSSARAWSSASPANWPDGHAGQTPYRGTPSPARHRRRVDSRPGTAPWLGLGYVARSPRRGRLSIQGVIPAASVSFGTTQAVR